MAEDVRFHYNQSREISLSQAKLLDHRSFLEATMQRDREGRALKRPLEGQGSGSGHGGSGEAYPREGGYDPWYKRPFDGPMGRGVGLQGRAGAQDDMRFGHGQPGAWDRDGGRLQPELRREEMLRPKLEKDKELRAGAGGQGARPEGRKELYCHRCTESGHVQKECPNPPVCYGCKKSGHVLGRCPELAKKRRGLQICGGGAQVGRCSLLWRWRCHRLLFSRLPRWGNWWFSRGSAQCSLFWQN
ncbi:ATP-dependent RNA helicase glh-1-like [Brachypodium distachyon]|uniref:ATP-dependent RNA helicase glh-1-like n=1 Tax=Brachypodium distachyon TaxID=15368 RepID=UPI000D0D5A48|nr:ATP-dependent RNA helicase glh-1-like [Brachypodium distachyon]|eukprot:XP_024313277.1 ATP-dependent RNA helicase glh-1-like [Brachypodium distachyon]